MSTVSATQLRSKMFWLLAAISFAGLVAIYQLQNGAPSKRHREGQAIVAQFLKDHEATFGGGLEGFDRSERIRLLDGLAKGEYPGLFGPGSLYVKTSAQKEAVLGYLMSELGSEGYFDEFPSDDQDLQEAKPESSRVSPPQQDPS